MGKHWLRKMPMIIWRADSVPTELTALGKKFENRALICMCLIQLDASGRQNIIKKEIRSGKTCPVGKQN